NLYPPDDEVHFYTSGHARTQNAQFNEWMNTAHANALNAMRESDAASDACLDCHSADFRMVQHVTELHEMDELEGIPPDPITLENAEFGVTCISCHNPHADPTEVDFYLRETPA